MSINETGPEPDPPGLPLPPLPGDSSYIPPPGGPLPPVDQVTTLQITDATVLGRQLMRAVDATAARAAIAALSTVEVDARIALAGAGGPAGHTVVDNGDGTATIT